MKEKALYQVVANELSREFKWIEKPWIAGTGKELGKLVSSTGPGRPDIIGVAERDHEIHIVEAKLLQGSRHMFSTAFGQLDTWKDYADRLWLAFDGDGWRNIPAATREGFVDQLNAQDFGLVLADTKAAHIEIQPRRNRKIDPLKQRNLLRQLKISQIDESIPAITLDPVIAKSAAIAVAWCAELLRVEVRQVTGIGSPQVPDEYDTDVPYFVWSGWYDKHFKNGIGVSGDPFGYHLQDGRPCLWVWRRVRVLQNIIRRTFPMNTYLYVSRPDGQERVRPISDFDLTKSEKEGFTESPWLCWPIHISGRLLQGIKEDIDAAWTEAHRRKTL